MSDADRNRAVMQMHGYTTPPTQDQINATTAVVYKQPELNEYEKISIEILNDAYKSEQGMRAKPAYYTSADFKSKEVPFESAYNKINQMLSGEKTLSIKDAYFYMENAFGDSYLSYKEYSNAITESANYIKKWLQQNGYDIKNNEHLHYGIQSFMKDTLSVKIITDNKTVTKTVRHLPYRYDYTDFEARKDHRNFYVTKCLATGYGQCNSLPVVYLLLSEALGAKCYLSFAPQHSLIKYPDNKGQLHNYEPTSNYKLNDKWYKDNLHISNLAVENGIYLDTLNKKMIVANCIQDLGFAYMVKLGLADGKYSIKCANQALKYFPKANNISSYFLRSEIISRIIERYMYENHITNIDEARKVQIINNYYVQLLDNETAIKELGYQKMPETLYLELMGIHTEKLNKQQSEKVNAKQKRKLFY